MERTCSHEEHMCRCVCARGQRLEPIIEMTLAKKSGWFNYLDRCYCSG